jgi:hypothetical protein
MLVKTFGSAVYGVDAVTITVETSVEQGMKYFMVGLPDNAVKESQHRVETAIKHINYKMPRQKNCHQPRPCRYSKRRLCLRSYHCPWYLSRIGAN